MQKYVISVSKKNNSIWKIYFYDENFQIHSQRINPLLVWYYKLKKSKIHNNICDNCFKEFRFYKSRFDKMPNECFECNPDEY